MCPATCALLSGRHGAHDSRATLPPSGLAALQSPCPRPTASSARAVRARASVARHTCAVRACAGAAPRLARPDSPGDRRPAACPYPWRARPRVCAGSAAPLQLFQHTGIYSVPLSMSQFRAPHPSSGPDRPSRRPPCRVPFLSSCARVSHHPPDADIHTPPSSPPRPVLPSTQAWRRTQQHTALALSASSALRLRPPLSLLVDPALGSSAHRSTEAHSVGASTCV